ncbi:S8 family serine peptidase [Kitasatospora sp. NPDC004240]
MRVIAYYMHESEEAAALGILGNASSTGSFVVGDAEENDLPRLEEAGLTVDRLDGNGQADSSALARSLIAAPGSAAFASAEAAPEAEAIPLDPGTPGQWVLRLGEPLLEAYREQIRATGTVLQQAFPSRAYLVTATPEQAEAVVNLPFVKSVERYGPRLAAPVRLAAAEPGGGPGAVAEGGGGPEAAEAAEAEPTARTWDLVVTDEAVRPSVRGWIAARVDDPDTTILAEGGRRLRIRLPAGSPLENEIKQVPGVAEMSQYVPPRLLNDVARVLMGVTANGNPGTADLPFRGNGQIVAVADTGLDATHPDFAGRVVDAVALGRPGDTSDPHGHGTHVSGSILGDGSASSGALRGVAPEAKLYFQSVMDAAGNLGGLPLSLEDLFEPAFQAGARIHNNSWGAETEAAYTANSDDVDAFVRRRRDMLIIIAAGNSGTAAVRLRSQPGFVDWLSVESPGSSKNALTVGASRTSRTDGPTGGGITWGDWQEGQPFPDPPIADEKVSGDPQGLAAFSSRGPCDDWRVKPDLVAPGTDILSARSAAAPPRHFWGLHANTKYAFMGGTSMATPLVAGCAALVREYYVKVRQARPSAALLKATLINGTKTLTGQDAAADNPHFQQGFGAVHLPTTVPNPGNPDLVLSFVDNWEAPAQQLDNTGDRVRFTVEAAAGMPLRLCLAYTDLPGRALQNDLSVLVQAPDGTKQIGNSGLPAQLLATDCVNNVEVVRFPTPKAGKYLIQVFARNLLKGPQDFALVVTGKLTAPLKRVP